MQANNYNSIRSPSTCSFPIASYLIFLQSKPEYWKQLVFTFDMDNRQSQNSSRAQRRGSNPRSAGSANISQPQTQEVIIPLSCLVMYNNYGQNCRMHICWISTVVPPLELGSSISRMTTNFLRTRILPWPSTPIFTPTSLAILGVRYPLSNPRIRFKLFPATTLSHHL